MISRARRFSPNSVDRDASILHAVAERVEARGHSVRTVDEAMLATAQRPDMVFTMGREHQTVETLRQWGVTAVNTPEGVANCVRSTIEATMRRIGTPMAPAEGPHGYWLKRGDGAAQGSDDVVFAPDRETLRQTIGRMEARGVGQYTVSAHVRGDVVKFYGVRGTSFFRHYYPTDDGQTKFGDERMNGEAHHYGFSLERLHSEADRLAGALDVAVYGGDCIVRADGTFCVIDFNDWPSFSRCREEAADAIASLLAD